jgi:inosine/xanthosine triphosphatase
MFVAIGSNNPAKISAVRQGFKDYSCTFIPVAVSSGVSDQPFSDDETIRGAVNRAISAAAEAGADIGVGLEGGVQQTEHGLFLCNWGALVLKGSQPIIAGGARIPLPQVIAGRLISGEELGPVMDDYARKQNVRKKEGAVGVFTNGKVDRAEMFAHVMKLLVGQYENRHRP